MSLSYGTIIRVKLEANSIHFGKQGFVIRNDDLQNSEGPIRIWFGRECDNKMSFRRREKMRETRHDEGLIPPIKDDENNARIFNYNESDVVIESAWTTETLAKRHFDGSVNFISSIERPFSLGNPCYVKDCENEAKKRIVFNIWGHVMDADVCEECETRYSFVRCDDVPLKNQLEYTRACEQLVLARKKLEESLAANPS